MNAASSSAPLLSEAVAAPLRRVTLAWMAVMFVLFVVLALLGLYLRLGQSNLHAAAPETFYSALTLHGLGMVGLWFVAAMAGVSYVLGRHVRISVGASVFALGATAIGVALLVVSTLLGRMGVGWYFLYPLPLHPGGVWPSWATALFFATIGVLGVGWLVWVLSVLVAIARRHSLSWALGWHYLRGEKTPEIAPIILITTVSLIAALAGLVSGVIVLVLFLAEWLGRGFVNDALLMKNLTFLFGHLLVNITLYLGVAMLYELMPAYAGRPWKTNKLVALAWNSVLLLVIFAFFHHLYMDFVQVRLFQVIGQVASYLTSVPAAVMTIFGLLALVYGANMRWTLSSRLLFLGVLGWTVGGIGAVIDSTVSVNLRFHNTLWVPAHFHTYFLMGVVLMVLGAVYHILQELTRLPERPGLAKWSVLLLCLGGYGFVLMFYYAGASSVPRRYATYPAEVAAGVTLARIATGFILVFLAGLALYLWETGRRCWRALAAGP